MENERRVNAIADQKIKASQMLAETKYLNEISLIKKKYEDDKRKSSYDEKISLTILSILRSFFTDKNNVLLFICDAQDDRQCGRNLLFSKWYHIYGSKAYHKEDLVINVGGTCSYYASFICRKDHPSLKIMQETFIDFQKKNSK